MLWRKAEWTRPSNACRSFAARSAATMSTSNLQRHFSREEEARNQAAVEIARKLKLPLLATNGVCYALPQQREAARCLHLHPPSPHARNRRPPAEPQFRAPFEVARGNGAAFRRSSRSHRQHGSSFLAPAIHAERSRATNFPKYPVPDGESQMQFLRERTHEGMLCRYGPDDERARAADRSRTGPDRKARISPATS